MMPLAFGRPFLDWVLSALADAGIRNVCLVIAPDYDDVRKYYSALTLTRLRINFAIQQQPRGTADAVLAAESFADGDVVLALNADNFYPVEAYRALTSLGAPALAAFERDALLQYGNIGAERIEKYALVHVDQAGNLRRIVEKPDPATMASWTDTKYVSMNLWSFSSDIFAACRAIQPSVRGELELPAAVQYAIDTLGVQFRAVPVGGPAAGVLDLTGRGDIQSVTERLAVRRPVL
jgi:glucose-1-phosphate thymidylyltransferase